MRKSKINNEIPMVRKGVGRPKLFLITNLRNHIITGGLRIQSTYSKAIGRPKRRSGKITDSFWTNYNEDHLKVVLAARNESY